MKWLLALWLLLPAGVMAETVSGIDDINPNLPIETRAKLDDAITTYYKHPDPKKVEIVLDAMNDSALLQKKVAWPPLVGFLTVIFENNKPHLFDWMARHDYNNYAQDVFAAALVHARLNETAMVFAQAHGWSKARIYRLRSFFDTVDMKHMQILLPGHIDTLWGAFFASGDKIYIDEMLTVFTGPDIASEKSLLQEIPGGALIETKALIGKTLRYYAPSHPLVVHAIRERAVHETDPAKQAALLGLLTSSPPGSRQAT